MDRKKQSCAGTDRKQKQAGKTKFLVFVITLIYDDK
jgi:hypothetical protein